MSFKVSETTYRYVISTAITFAAGFLMVVTPEVQQLSVDALQDGTVVGIILAGVRAGLKAVAEAFILPG